jgi:membrane protease YdiL (CAAX protease family)
MSAVVSDQPAFAARWPGWRAMGFFGLLIGALFVAQLIVSITIIVTQFDAVDIMRSGSPAAVAGLAEFLRSPAGLARLVSPTNLFVLQLCSSGAVVVLTLSLCRSIIGASPQNLGFGQPTTGRTIAIGVAAGLGLLLVSLLVESIQEALFGPHPQAIVAILEQHHGTLAFVLDIVSVSLLAPVAEELLFRGVLFTALVQRMPLPWAAVISGFLFAGSHLEGWSIVPLAVLGVGLAYVYYHTRNLWANIATHGTINGISLIIAFAFPQFGSH